MAQLEEFAEALVEDVNESTAMLEEKTAYLNSLTPLTRILTRLLNSTQLNSTKSTTTINQRQSRPTTRP